MDDPIEEAPHLAKAPRLPFARIHIGVLAVLIGLGSLCFDARAGSLSASMRSRLVASEKVGSAVIDGLDRSATVRVMIALRPAAPSPSTGLQRERTVAMIRSMVDRALKAVPPRELVLLRRFQSVSAIAADASAEAIANLAGNPDVLRVDVDGGGSGNLLQALPLANFPPVRSLGLSGAGVTVAVIDSGVDTDHPDLSDDLVGEQCFCSGGGGCCPGGGTTESGAGSAEDDNGHGTNVSGIISSKGSVAPQGGAPDAKVVAVKVLDANNFTCCMSDTVAALDWVLNNRPDVSLVNMSLGTFALYPGDCDSADAVTMSLAAAIDQLRANGVAVFASSGNQASPSSMAAPACVKNTISVGAVWDSNVGPTMILGCTDTSTAADQVTCFTNSDDKLDLVAPGAPTTSTGIGGGVSVYYGTSQASPLVAACAALLRQDAPGLSVDDLETSLKTSPTLVTDAKNSLPFPRLDCSEALTTAENRVAASTLCSTTPRAGCRGAASGHALLRLRDSAKIDRDRLVWRWTKGDETPVSALGDPVSGGTDYGLCLYDEEGGPPTLKMEAAVPGGGVCAGRPCWRATRAGFVYRDEDRAQGGVEKIVLKSGAAGRAKVIVRSRGRHLHLPSPVSGGLLAESSHVTVQLVNSESECWEAAYSRPALRVRPDLFKDKND